MKYNVDDGFNNQRGTTNKGWCYRDNNGRFILTGIFWDVGCYSVIEVEALAFKEVVLRAI